MPKRKNKNSEDYILRKLEKKLTKRRNRKRSSSTFSENSHGAMSLTEDTQREQSVDVPHDKVSDPVVITEQSTESISPIPEPQLDSIVCDLPSTSTESNEPEIVLDEKILQLLGDTPTKNKTYSTPIQTELAVRWEHIATTGLTKDLKKELLEKYFLPENCVKIGSPQLNPEVKAALSEALLKKDKAIELKQNQQALAITCISQALTKILVSENKDADIIKLLIDATRLLCDSQYVESMSRRSFVASTIKKDLKDQLYATEIDTFLFGEKLSETLKAAKAINRSGAELKTAPPKVATSTPSSFNPNRSLNVRPPLPPARQAGAARRSQTTTQQPRRYQTPVPLPPPPPPPPQQPLRFRGRTQTRR